MDPLCASPLEPSGYTWTIASRVSNALAEAEERFGPRDKNYFYAGHEFIDGNPKTWYPGGGSHIIIQLGKRCLTEPNQAVFQLAHEVIHLLSPTGGKYANNLEEGLANWFSEDYCLRVTGQQLLGSLPCYREASNLVGRMLEENPECIKSMRESEPRISRIQKPLLLTHCPSLSDSEAAFLTSKFVRSKPSTCRSIDQKQ